jgi:hypothetical protein
MPSPFEFDENNPYYQIRLLAQRVDQLTKEKEEAEENIRGMEKRIATMERSFQRGAGALIVLPIAGTIVGVLLAYGKLIFAPWITTK